MVDCDVMYVMSSTPFMASSSGVTTLLSTVSALAPVYVALTMMVGGAMSGYCSMGRLASPMMPTSTMSTDIAPERMGRLTNIFTFIGIMCC